MTWQLNWLEHCTDITGAGVQIAASLIFCRLSFCNCISFKYLGITHDVLQDILGILGKGDWPLHWLKQQILFYGWKFPPNTCALIGYFEVTWHLIMKWFFHQNLWAGNIVKSMIILIIYIVQITGNINIWSNVPDIMTAKLMLTNDHHYSEVKSISSFFSI